MNVVCLKWIYWAKINVSAEVHSLEALGETLVPYLWSI